MIFRTAFEEMSLVGFFHSTGFCMSQFFHMKGRISSHSLLVHMPHLFHYCIVVILGTLPIFLISILK